MLRPDNATGNFTKLVQRLPVRIAVPAEVAREGILRPGLSVVVDVHTRDERQPAPSLVGALGLETLVSRVSQTIHDVTDRGHASGHGEAEPAAPQTTASR